ncbi:MAG: Hint domain-containing protein [Roseobacter sp.]
MFGWNVAMPVKLQSAVFTASELVKMATKNSTGVMSGTLVATQNGWRAADTLSVGDRVLTFDNGLQPIVEIKRRMLWTDDATRKDQPWPVVIPEDVLGNEREIVFLPDQGVMLESENALDAMGDPYAIMPAQVLEGICGIESAPAPHAMELLTLVFAGEEVIYIDGSLLLHCPVKLRISDVIKSASGLYDVKSLRQAQAMLTDLDLAELALREPESDLLAHSKC